MKLSIVLPIYNEEENIAILHNQLGDVLNNLGMVYEIIMVDDGSTDDSLSKMKQAAKKDDSVRIISFVRNFGQTAAMSAGIKSAQGDVIMPMDSDLQNNPEDIPLFLNKINDGYDVVSGWRKNRWSGSYFSRKLPSEIANYLISSITGLKLHDYGCSMKAYKSEFIKGVSLYGEMHRFIPAYIYWGGGKVTEIPINDRPRIHGVTKYGISRTFKVLLDLLVIKFLSKYLNRPMHFFGGVGFISLFVGLILGLLAVFLKLASIRHFVDTPLPVISTFFVIVGVQMIAIGVLSEMIMRVYYESRGSTPYIIKEKLNF